MATWVDALRALLALMLAVLGFNARRAQAQSYPSKNVTIVVSIGAGTGMDVLVRLYAEKLSGGAWQAGGGREQARRRDHAGGGAGRDLAARRPHAGGADQRRDGDQPVALQADQLQPRKRFRADLALREIAVHPGGRIRICRSRPCRSSSSTPRRPTRRSTTPRSARAALQHLSMEFAKQRFGFDAIHVPYRQTGQSVTDLAAGHVDVGFVEAGASIPLIKEGRLRALAVSASQRLPLLAGGAAVLGGRRARRISRRCPGTSCWRRRRRRRTSSTGCTRR